MENNSDMTFYIIKVGSKYCRWNHSRGTITLTEDPTDAYQYNFKENALLDIKSMEQEGKYKSKKKRILKVSCTFEEV